MRYCSFSAGDRLSKIFSSKDLFGKFIVCSKISNPRAKFIADAERKLKAAAWILSMGYSSCSNNSNLSLISLSKSNMARFNRDMTAIILIPE